MNASAETASLPENPYLGGNYRPTQSEITAEDLVVLGRLPDDLEGTFVRTGANPRFPPRGRYHWFDGDGMVHAVELGAGKATYRNRYVRTEALAQEEAAGQPLWTGIMEPPDLRRPGGPYKDTANTDLVYHAGKLLALWWLGGKAHVLSLPDLETRGVETFGGRLQTGISAHPKVDPVTGEMMFIDFGPRPPYLTYGVVSHEGELVHQASIDLPGPRLQHDIAITERFTIVMDLPMYNDPDMLKQGKVRLRYYRDQPSRFGLLPRHGKSSDIRWFEASPCYMYHTINAWEEGDSVVMLGCKIENPLAGDPANPRGPELPILGLLQLGPVFYRWRFDLETGLVHEEPLDDVHTEFPRMDNRLLGRKSRYSYNPRVAKAKTLLFDGVVKYDVEKSTSTAHAYSAGCHGGETAFAPRVGSTAEDDGYLITFVTHEETGESHLYVIDAKDVAAEPVARVRIPQRVPTGYHSWWVPQGEREVRS